MPKIKMKSKRALMKRIKITGTGKAMRHHAYVSHLAANKTTKQKRHLRKSTSVHKSDYKRIKFLIGK
ncbi:MAG: 50S ribosomal protein L35 [Erysipelotrichia bacterium]|nr:50S ribosomal protein L35 [Erysipelotrichia bacterium]